MTLVVLYVERRYVEFRNKDEDLEVEQFNGNSKSECEARYNEWLEDMDHITVTDSFYL